MRDPTVTSYLPTILAVRPDLQTALNRGHGYEAACARTEFTGTNTAEEQRRAYETIKSRVSAAYNRLDLGPTDRQKLVKIAEDFRTENIALKTLTERQREQIKHLEAALVRAVGGVGV